MRLPGWLRRLKPKERHFLGLGDDVTSIRSEPFYFSVTEGTPTQEQLSDFEQRMQREIGPKYKLYRDADGKTDLPAIVLDSTKPVFGLVGNPLGLTVSSMSYSQADDGQPTGIELCYQRAGSDVVYIKSPEVEDEAPGLFERMSRRRLQISSFTTALANGVLHDSVLATEPRAIGLRGRRGQRWDLPTVKLDVMELDLSGSKCLIGLVNLTESEIETVLNAVERIDSHPEVAVRAKEEMWTNFEVRRRRS